MSRLGFLGCINVSGRAVEAYVYYDGLQEQLRMLQGQAGAFKQAEVESILEDLKAKITKSMA